MTDKEREERIVALIQERNGYAVRGMEERVDQVNQELAQLGHGGAPPARRAVKRTPRPKETRTKKAEER